MFEKVYGSTKKQAVIRPLIERLDELNLTGTFYVGYPILASAEESITLDALLVTSEHGLIVFILSEIPEGADTTSIPFWETLRDAQDRLYFAVEANLKRHPSLRSKRGLGVDIKVLTILPEDFQPPLGFEETHVAGPNTFKDAIASFPELPPEFVRPLNAALQRVTTIKPLKKRSSAVRNGSRGSILKEIEREIANLDRWQKQAAIETPEGPQRIRGLAGSGKTIVLALKAAYLHAQHPDWNIVLTFQSRALYQQLIDLVRRFSFEHLGDEPDWNKLHIMHAWGGARAGVYTSMASHAGIPARDFLYAKSKYGWDNAFRGICDELLSSTINSEIAPLFDAVLIDEAQDLPWQFFRLVYRFTSNPKRIIWAYDELQHLSEAAMPTLKELFGVTENGELNINLDSNDGEARRDIILPVCYRNTPWALTVAHALGFGIYREGGKLVQHFDEPTLWEEIGYEKIAGELNFGSNVTLKRDPKSYPSYFSELLTPEDSVSCHVFNNALEQADWIAESIKKNLTEDELEPSDIFIVLPSALTAAKESMPIIEALGRKKIVSHLVGATTSVDEIFSNNSVAITHIHRAKGNEAPMVYVANSHVCYKGYELIKLRNTLFTAITRCRGWVRICGHGADMPALKVEVDQVQVAYTLSFQIPTQEELAKLRKIHRDRSSSEKTKIKRAEKGLSDFLRMLSAGEIKIENLPPELREQLLRQISALSSTLDYDDPQQD